MTPSATLCIKKKKQHEKWIKPSSFIRDQLAHEKYVILFFLCWIVPHFTHRAFLDFKKKYSSTYFTFSERFCSVFDIIASYSGWRYFSCTSTMWVSHSTTSCSHGLSIKNIFFMFKLVWDDILRSGWKHPSDDVYNVNMKGWIWSTTILG